MITKNLRHRFIDRVTNGQFVDRQKYRQEVIDKQPQTREPQTEKKNHFRQKKCLIQQASFRQNDSWSERQLTNKKSNRIRLERQIFIQTRVRQAGIRQVGIWTDRSRHKTTVAKQTGLQTLATDKQGQIKERLQTDTSVKLQTEEQSDRELQIDLQTGRVRYNKSQIQI